MRYLYIATSSRQQNVSLIYLNLPIITVVIIGKKFRPSLSSKNTVNSQHGLIRMHGYSYCRCGFFSSTKRNPSGPACVQKICSVGMVNHYALESCTMAIDTDNHIAIFERRDNLKQQPDYQLVHVVTFFKSFVKFGHVQLNSSGVLVAC